MNTQQNPPKNPQNILKDIFGFLQEIFDLSHYIDKDNAREEIKGSINFKGMAAYILVASVMVASIGLNANSVAVVIGAMLISPLMGPIVGLGYSIAVNDIETLKRSFINFGIMVGIALATSFIYFSLFPNSLTEQLKGRIEPTALDVMIAFFGGFAGIAALSSKVKNANVVAGVAIATALMPPLCTAGYGLSEGLNHIGYKDYTGLGAALNAMYLFFINSVFIAISTFTFVKFTRFPLAKYQNPTQAKRTNYFIVGLAIITMIPSGIIFYNILQESAYKINVNKFLSREIKTAYPDAFLNLDNPLINKTDSINIIALSTISERIPDEVIKNWNIELQQNYGLKDTRLIIHQGAYDASIIEKQSEAFLSSVFEQNQLQLKQKDSIIQAQRAQINRLNSDSIPFHTLSRELKSQYPNLDHFGYAIFNYTNFNSKTSLPTFIVTWKNASSLDSTQIAQDEKRVRAYLKARLKLDTLQILKE